MKNYNIKISEEDEDMISYIRDRGCINISQFLRQCIKDKYEDIKNERKKNHKGVAENHT